MDRLRLKGEGGFTLIELLVVIAIIGILAAIAIPQFAAYRKRGYEAAVKSDLRNAATAMEGYYAQNQTYALDALTSAWGYNPSTNVTMTGAVGAQTFILTASHTQCTGVSWTFSNVNGQITGPACP